MEKEMFEALAKVQYEVGKIKKDKTNPYYSSLYFDVNSLLDVVKPILRENRFLVIQPIRNMEVVTVLVHSSGAELHSGLSIPETITDPQKIGSVISYYRRYTLQSLLAIEAEDDDANMASGKVKPKPKQDDNKPWLNLKDKAGNFTSSYKKLLEEHEKNGVTMSFIKSKYKVSKETLKLLNQIGIK